MENVQQYLEKRIEILKEGLANSLYSKLTAQQYRTLLQELEQVFTLFNEEYEKHKMEIVKEYLDRRNQELQELYLKVLASENYLGATTVASSMTELKKVITLFDK